MERPLYDRFGGTGAITAVVRAVADRQLKDDRINQKFARTNVDRLIKQFAGQICQATGGPCKYTGRNMTEAHRNMGVTNGEFDAFVEDVVAVLDDFKVGKAEQDGLLNLLAPLRAEIVEVGSDETGTPLPSEFTPAPAEQKMNRALWIAAGVLAAVLLVSAINKLVIPKEKLAAFPAGGWAEDFSPGALKAISTVEILGAVGLILPAVLGIAPVVVPLAATGAALLFAGAVITRLRRGEKVTIVLDLVDLALAVFVAWGRFGPGSFTADQSGRLGRPARVAFDRCLRRGRSRRRLSP